MRLSTKRHLLSKKWLRPPIAANLVLLFSSCPGAAREHDESLERQELREDQVEFLESVGFVSSLLGDVDGDGVSDFAVGVPGESSRANFAGALWIVSGRSRSIIHRLGGEVEGQRLGVSVLGGGDVNNDGVGDVIVSTCGSEVTGNRIRHDGNITELIAGVPKK